MREIRRSRPPARNERAHIVPVATPDSDTLLFTILPSSLDGSRGRIGALSQATGTVTHVLEDATVGTYVPSGHLFYAQGNQRFLTVPFDLDRLSVSGLPTVVPFFGRRLGQHRGRRRWHSRLRTTAGWRPRAAHADMGVSGRPRGTARVGARPLHVPRISPDGRRIAVERGAGAEQDVWVHDLDRGTFGPLTREAGVDRFPLWTPDGDDIVFTSSRDGGPINLYRRSADGTGPVTRLATSDSAQFPYSWSPNGQDLVFVEQTPGADATLNIQLLPMRRNAVLDDQGLRIGAGATQNQCRAQLAGRARRERVRPVALPAPQPGRSQSLAGTS